MVDKMGDGNVGKKKEIRGMMLERRNRIQNREERSGVIIQKILKSDEYKSSPAVLAYSSIGSEVMTDRLLIQIIKDKKILYLPKVIDIINVKMEFFRLDHLEQLQSGYKGIKEPASESLFYQSTDSVLMLIPGIAFDSRKMRMGYGKGFYDRYLAKCDPNIIRIMPAFTEQKADYIPAEITDIPMDRIITG